MTTRLPTVEATTATPRFARAARPSCLLLLLLLFPLTGGCATIRTTDPPRTATEQFLLTQAAAEAIEQLSLDALRDRLVFVDSQYLIDVRQTPTEVSFLVGELRARMLQVGVRLAAKREEAEVIVEVRSGGVGIDRLEFLLGIPSGYIPGLAGSVGADGVAIVTPELAIIKSTRQAGVASVAIVAYVAKTGELLATSGPFVGRTSREDYWFFGTGPRTLGDIPPVRRAED